MKHLFYKKIVLLVVFLCLCLSNTFAKSIVYFFVDFRFWRNEYIVKVNGQEGFKLVSEVSKEVVPGGPAMYKMIARKVIFKEENTYVLSCDCETNHGTMTAELNLNIEDGQTYYVVFNAGMKNPFYAELLSEKDGLKLLKKAQKSKKYTFNEDLVYEEK